jgi:hypothetical protein
MFVFPLSSFVLFLMHRGYLSPTVDAICLILGEQLKGGGAIYYLLSVLTLSRSPVAPRNGSCVSFMTNHNRHDFLALIFCTVSQRRPLFRTDVDIEVIEVVVHTSTAPGSPSMELVG